MPPAVFICFSCQALRESSPITNHQRTRCAYVLCHACLRLAPASFASFYSAGTLNTLPESFNLGDDRTLVPNLITLPFYISRNTDFPESVAQRDDGVDTAAAGVAGRLAPSCPDGRSFDKGKARLLLFSLERNNPNLALILQAIVVACAYPLGLSSPF